jgi:hypothetical protein
MTWERWPRTCKVTGCDRHLSTRGLCNMHYRRWLRSGRLTIGPDLSRMICTVPSHQHEHDNLGACVVCGVPTVVGLHPNARTKLLLKRPDLAHLADHV